MLVSDTSLKFLPLRVPKPEAPLFIFLPGMDGTGQLFRAQIGELEGEFDIRCVMIPPTDLTDWEGLAEQVANLIQAEIQRSSHRTVYLCGESFGGCLALKVVQRSPELIHRMILVNPASSYNRRPWLAWGGQFAQLLPDSLYYFSCLGLLPFLANLERIETENRQTLFEAMCSVSQQSSVWRLSLLRNFHIPQTDLARIKQPVLLVASQADRLLPSLPEVERLAESLPRSQTYVLPDSGHACLLEMGVNLYQIMREANFLGDRKTLMSAPAVHPSLSERP